MKTWQSYLLFQLFKILLNLLRFDGGSPDSHVIRPIVHAPQLHLSGRVQYLYRTVASGSEGVVVYFTRHYRNSDTNVQSHYQGGEPALGDRDHYAENKRGLTQGNVSWSPQLEQPATCFSTQLL